MIGKKNFKNKIGWRFDNTYSALPGIMLSKLSPVPVRSPKLVILNKELSKDLDLNFSSIDNNELAEIFSGNLLPEGSESIAQAYAGHQFGHLTMLGDGRAITIGEHINKNNKRYDIQFKGSGLTPYSRNADGRAALSPMLREYIISEAMHGLDIPTTRSLAVVTTGEDVIRETPLPGAILTRVASSHMRVGTFQYAALHRDIKLLKKILNYAVERHYPNLKGKNNLAIELLRALIEKQTELVTNWMRVGFIHGVMNTDNMTISGETIDYGPCAFMDNYDPETVFSSIDHHGRYAYCNQPNITKWNLSRFAETLLPLIDENKDKAISIANELINSFNDLYEKKWLLMMRKKLGIFGEETKDKELIEDLLKWMKQNKVDYTNTFCSLGKTDVKKNKHFQDSNFINWYKRWESRLADNKKTKEESLILMKANNPLIIPRNHIVEESLEAVTNTGNLKPLNLLLNYIKKPYTNQPGISDLQIVPKLNGKKYITFCGT
tara:strand:- start:725 stop:2203 length:1479 start_codon:yes stop_codon:yes gene_type:complete